MSSMSMGLPPPVPLKEVASGSITTDGTEQTIVERTVGEKTVEGHLDLSNMASGDTVTIREYIKLKSGGSYIPYAIDTYTDAQTEKSTYAIKKAYKHGWKLTIQQTTGTYKSFDYEIFEG